MKRISINLILLCLTISLSAKDKPNVIILLADDLGWADLGYQGSDDIRSPHIDSLAKNGIRFTDGHVSASVCSPSRAGLMTGRYQQRFGHEANSPPPFRWYGSRANHHGGPSQKTGIQDWVDRQVALGESG